MDPRTTLKDPAAAVPRELVRYQALKRRAQTDENELVTTSSLDIKAPVSHACEPVA